VPAPLDKSHPEVVAEIRRLARLEPRPTITEIRDAIKEKFNYPMLGNTVKKWAGVDFETRSGIPITQKQIDDIVRLKSVDNPPTDIEVAKKLNIGVASVRNHKPGGIKPYLTVEQWAEIYPDMSDNLLSNDKEIVAKARDAAYHRREREVVRIIREAAAQEIPFDPLTDKEMRKLANSKAADILSTQKERAKMYRISRRSDPSSFIFASEYKKLEKKPKILGTIYRGDFSTDAYTAMKKMYSDEFYDFLKAGGNPNHIPFHFGHILPFKGEKMSGFTNPPNIEIQDKDFNIHQSNKISKERLRKLGYHAPGFMGLILGGVFAPWEEIFASPFQEGAKYAAEVTTGLNVDEAIKDPSRLRPGRIGATIAEDTIVPLSQMIAGGLSSENIPQEPYYGMGRQRGLLDIGHTGIGEEEQKRRTNIWT